MSKYPRVKQLMDSDPMPFGKYKGTKMEDVPASYLDWLDGEGVQGAVADYIRRNRDVIHSELEQKE